MTMGSVSASCIIDVTKINVASFRDSFRTAVSRAAAAVMSYAREVLRLDQILAITSPDNEASAKLLGKIGLRFERMMKLSEDAREVKLFST